MTTKRVLRGCPMFEHLNAVELEAVVSIAEAREYEAGATIFNQKDAAEQLFVVEKGKVALQMQLQLPPPQVSKKITVDIVNSGEVLGWSVLVPPYRYTLTAVCLEPTRVVATNGIKLRSLIQNNQRVGYEVLSQIIKVVASRLDETCHVLVSERSLSA